MSKTGSIILIEDDPDDQELIKRAIGFLSLPNEVKVFRDGEEALAYLTTMSEQPFLIISDINMPAMDGIRLKRNIDSNPALRSKSIPFVYLTTGTNPNQLRQAYDLTVQGFFLKGNDFNTLKEVLRLVIDYWMKAKHPNN
jgi:CheY-like chemotaxis protein